MAEDLFPKLKVEDLGTLLKDLEKDVQGLLLAVIIFIKGEVCQIGEDWEPKAFMHTQKQLLVGGLLPSFRLFSSAAFASHAILRRVVAHIL